MVSWRVSGSSFVLAPQTCLASVMAMKVDVVLDSDDYSSYDDTTNNSVNLTSKQSAILSSVAVLLLYRSVWQDMNDAEWNDLSDRISDALDALDNAI